uniref:Uncharacterized protein n=1 Tax=viral metagenome TaxID=1070528 RepID=A0A6M3L084_9ZZZZ
MAGLISPVATGKTTLFGTRNLKMDRIKDDIREIKETVKDIYKILNGNGSEGIVTKVALNRQSIKRAWIWLGSISIGIMGIAFFVIKASINK